jgi:hypothetical protein
MRKNVIRLLLAMALLVSGSLVPSYVKDGPMPIPWPPMQSN